MYAIIKTGGKQYKVSSGDEIFVEKLAGEAGDKVEFDQVLAVAGDEDLKLGSDLSGVKVSGEIVKQGRGKKIRVFKYKPKKGYRRTQGHRQPYSLVRIEEISL
jgi:large subunit ribosomal protein L21